MHALHFTFGLGAFLAPLLARPFLINEDEITGEIQNATNLDTLEHFEKSDWTIKALYPIISCYSIISSFGVVFFFFKDYSRNDECQNVTKDNSETDEKKVNNISDKFTRFIVAIMSIMFFLYVGMEVAFGTFVSVFAVKSNLHFTRPQGI